MMNVYAYTPASRGLRGPRASCSCGGRSSRTLIMVTLPRVVVSQLDVDRVGSFPTLPTPFGFPLVFSACFQVVDSQAKYVSRVKACS
jgi:hypothetical protein